MHKEKMKGCQPFTIKMEKLEECNEFISQDGVVNYEPQDLQEVEDGEIIESKKSEMEKYPILKNFANVFLDELPGFPPKRVFDFSIDLILGL